MDWAAANEDDNENRLRAFRFQVSISPGPHFYILSPESGLLVKNQRIFMFSQNQDAFSGDIFDIRSKILADLPTQNLGII